LKRGARGDFHKRGWPVGHGTHQKTSPNHKDHRKGAIMKSIVRTTVFLFVLLAFAAVSQAQDFFVFPGQGQSQQQMDRDKVECQIWARQQTGFDPWRDPEPRSRRQRVKRPKAGWPAAPSAVQRLERLEGLSPGIPEEVRPSAPAPVLCWAA
jgi:hypothetical protein